LTFIIIYLFAAENILHGVYIPVQPLVAHQLLHSC